MIDLLTYIKFIEKWLIPHTRFFFIFIVSSNQSPGNCIHIWI